MTKVLGNISQLGVSGSIAQLSVLGSVAQLDVTGSIVEGGYVPDPPVYVSSEVGTIDAGTVVITFDRDIDEFSVPDISDFSITFSGGAVTITIIAIPAGNAIELTLNRLIVGGETGTFSYTQGTNAIKSKTTGDPVISLTGETITNNVPAGTIPVFVSAEVSNGDPNEVVLTYDQNLDLASIPDTTDFTVTDHTISTVSMAGAEVHLVLSTNVIYFDVLYVTYTKGANPIQGDVGELDAADLASTLVTNNVAVTGNEIFWGMASDLTTITKDGSNFVSAFNDKLGSGRNLVQAAGTNQPLWITPGTILGDGIDNYLKAAFTLNQPTYIIICFRQVTWTIADIILDGNTSTTGALRQTTASPGLAVTAGTTSSVNNNLPINTWGIARILFNGASSSFQIDATAAITGNFGANNMGGITLFARGNNTAWANAEVAEIIALNTAPSADYQTSLYNVVKRRNGL